MLGGYTCRHSPQAALTFCQCCPPPLWGSLPPAPVVPLPSDAWSPGSWGPGCSASCWGQSPGLDPEGSRDIG